MRRSTTTPFVDRAPYVLVDAQGRRYAPVPPVGRYYRDDGLDPGQAATGYVLFPITTATVYPVTLIIDADLARYTVRYTR